MRLGVQFLHHSSTDVGRLDLALRYGVGVDPERHRWVGMSEALRSVDRVLAGGDELSSVEMPERAQSAARRSSDEPWPANARSQ